MYVMSLDELYNFLVEEKKLYNFMSYNEQINLVPVSNVEYRDKIRGTMVSHAIGDIFGSDSVKTCSFETDSFNSLLRGEKSLESLSITNSTEMTIRFAESLIIYQGFNPEDTANRFARQSVYKMGGTIRQFVENYQAQKIEWHESGLESAGSGAAIRCAPAALINYGDYISLKLLSGIQAVITHKDQMAIASSILYGTAIAYLLNLPPFSLSGKEECLKFLHVCSKSIKGIETKVYRTRESNEIANLYTRVSIDLPEAIINNIPIDVLTRKWGSGGYALESFPLALLIFLKNSNDYDKILRESLDAQDANSVAVIALSLAGAYIGFKNISQLYINKVRNIEEMVALSDRLFEVSLKNKNNNPYRRMKETISEEKSQDVVDQLLWMGIKHNKQEEYELAVKYFEDLLVKNSDLKKNDRIKLHIIEAYEGLGTKLLGEEFFDNALRCFKKALAYDLNHPVILCDLAITYLNLDDLNKAEKYARRAVEIAPEYEIGREVLEAIKSLKKKNK
jgi:ADP-ribosyl-[dinitrogen reductase] hydrolase